jgi:hypothetical protein
MDSLKEHQKTAIGWFETEIKDKKTVIGKLEKVLKLKEGDGGTDALAKREKELR